MSGTRSRQPAATGTAGSTATPGLKDIESPSHDENIFTFIPNIIGYCRIVLAVASLYYMGLHPRTSRIYEQSTRFGAVLDMVTDRCTTSCLLVFLSTAFPRWIIIFQGLIALDLASHYVHMYATLSTGRDESHKKVDRSTSRILNMYYTNKSVLFTVCALNEVFFIALYLLSFSSPLLSPSLLQQVPAAQAIHRGDEASSSVIKQLFTNPYSAGALELARANKMDSTVPWIIASISFPVMALKQFINVVQLVKASQKLANEDKKARREKGLPRKHKTI